jgi:predicted nucleic acid-binding protein
MIVVDASVLIEAFADDGRDGRRARSRLGQESHFFAPELIDLEFLSVLRRQVRLGRLPLWRAEFALEYLYDFPLARHTHRDVVHRVWELRDALSPYDASYVAVAEILDCPVLTVDARLAKGAAHGGSPVAVEVLSVQ